MSARWALLCGLAAGRVSQVFPPTELQGLFDELIHCALKASRWSTNLCNSLLNCLALKIRDSRAPVDGTEELAFSTYQACRQHLQQPGSLPAFMLRLTPFE